MKRYGIAALLSASLLATPVFAMTDAECTAAWIKIDTKKSGTVSEAEAGRYYAALRVANKPLADGGMTRSAFLQHCKAGLFDRTVTDAGAPLPGANSFTEAQAKDRVIAAGYSTVSVLVKDADGVWRGTASDGTRTVKVAIDFKGNVVTN